MRFASPASLWLLLLLPLLAALLVGALIARRRLLHRFVEAPLAARLTRHVTPGRRYLKAGLLWAGVLFLILALAGPQFGARTRVEQQRGIDVVVALDVSRSMLAEDTKPSRLARARDQINRLLDGLPGDRVALVLFAGQAFVQCPLTSDYGALRLFLDLANVSSVAAQGTAIGDAIRVGSRCFDPQDPEHRAMVLFTDGEDHVGEPIEAAQAAAAAGVRIFAIGLGTAAGELIPDADGRGDYHQDRRGNYVKTHLDEALLTEIARVSNGAYYSSSLAGREVDEVAAQLSGLEQRSLGTTRYNQYEERFQVPLALALLCFLLETLLADGVPQRQEWRGRFA